MLLQLPSPSLVWNPTAVPLGWGAGYPQDAQSPVEQTGHMITSVVLERGNEVSRKRVLCGGRIMILRLGLWAQLTPQFGSISNADDAGWGGLQAPRMRSR